MGSLADCTARVAGGGRDGGAQRSSTESTASMTSGRLLSHLDLDLCLKMSSSLSDHDMIPGIRTMCVSLEVLHLYDLCP
jgi:hypothetical protein